MTERWQGQYITDLHVTDEFNKLFHIWAFHYGPERSIKTNN